MIKDENEDNQGAGPEHAEDALSNASKSAERARSIGWRWVRTYLIAWAAASASLVLGLGLGSMLVAIASLIAWSMLAIVGGIWSRSRGLAPRDGGRRIGRAAGLWAASYGIVLAVGVALETQSTGFWIAAALFTTVPLLVAALIPAPRTANVY